ncbi:MAG: tetratricopeptide repeat protein [Promethearchaeota archaeon]
MNKRKQMMNAQKNPENIYSRIVNNDINLNDGIKILITLQHDSEESEVIFECRATFKKLSKKYIDTFQIFKRLLEIDQEVKVRLSAAEELLLNYKNLSEDLLKTQIQKEISALFITEFYKFLNNQRDKISQNLNNTIVRKYKRIYGVTNEETLFFVDLEATQINRKNELDFQVGYFKRFSAPDILTLRKGNQYNYVIKNNHIIALDLSRWEFYEIPESIGLLSELEYLNLANLNLKHLPESIELLTKLEDINLNGNNLSKLPIWLVEFSNKKLTEKYINEGVLDAEVTILGLLEVISGGKLEKAQENDDVLTWEVALHYKVNKRGNIKGIYLRSERLKIGIFPSQICSLEFIEELELPGSSIEKIPPCIGNLQSLKFLNLSFNRIEIIPNSINKLKNLEHLNIIENGMSEKSLNAIRWNKDGEAFLDSGEYDKVIEECTTTLNIYPKHKFALFHLGIAYSEIGELLKAEQAYKKFLKIDPLSSVVWSSLSDIYHQEGDYDKAISAIKIALGIEPDIALLWSNLGINYKKLGKYNNAIESYLHSLEIDNKNKYVWKDLASIYRDRGEILKAIEAEERALEGNYNLEKN